MKKTNKLLSILLVMAMLLTIVPMNLSVSAAPDTDYNGYYKITNAGNLAWFACLVVGDTSQSGITEAEPDAKAVLTADIDITVLGERLGKSWVGIGTEEVPFTGIFDGNGYTIKGLTTDTSLTKSAVATVAIDTSKQGLFGVIGEGGVVRDVIVEGTANLSDTIKYGGICSENNGTIENVLSKITVNGGDNADVLCHTNNGTITNSFTNQTTAVASGVTVVDTDTLASGSVAYALGASFGQTIGTDIQPVHFDGTNRVYKDGNTYTNTEPTYAASVTDKDGNLISNYQTFNEAVKSAERSEGSTLTLLDNITVTGYQYINSGKFTIDLNGKTILHETTNTLWVERAADLTIKDSGVGGTIQTKGETSIAILSKGTLTIESGFFKGDGGINNHGTLTFKNGEVETGYYPAITNYGTAYVHNGTFESADGSAIVNNIDATIYIYDGKFSGYNAFTNYGTAYIESGEFKGNAFAALSLNGGTIEVTGGSFTGTDDEDGFYSGTPYGEYTVYDSGDGVLILKGGEFPNGFNSYQTTVITFLADGYYFSDADGKKITVAEDAASIEGYVKVKEDIAASVTDKDGNFIGKYKTFEEALETAENNEGSTLTLLDDVTVTEYYYITSGTFTIDLNDKTLSGEDTYILNVDSSVVLTITDSGENGTIEMNSNTGFCIYNFGKLTVEKVTIKGARGIDNRGICTLDGVIIEVIDREAFTNDGTAYIHNSVLKSEKDNAIGNHTGALLYVYDSKLTGDVGITSYDTAYVYNCEIKGTSYAALNLMSGTIEITGSSISGTDLSSGYYSGIPYGEWTVDSVDGVTLVFKDSEFPNGFTVNDTAAHTFLAEGYHFRDADGNIINLTENQRIIDGYVKVRKGADLEKEATVTLSGTEFEFTGEAIEPEVTVTVANKVLADMSLLDITYENNINAGKCTVTVTGAEDSGFTGVVTLEFTINPKTVDIIWGETTEFDYDGNAHSVTATYVDVNGETVEAVVENGTKTEIGRYTAVATIADTNYAINEETASISYIIKGELSLSGTVTSFGSETDEVTLLLYKAGDRENAYETTVTGNSAEYAFEGIGEGEYILEISKNNHATRTYEVVVGEENVTQDVKIHPKGDINGDGKVNTMDVARANAHAKGVSAIDGYDLKCADLNGDGKVNTMDVARMNAHTKGVTTLWQ